MARRATPRQPRAEDRILAAALALAEEEGWERVRMGAVAGRAGLTLAETVDHYQDQDAIADAWFARACRAMAAAATPALIERPAPERLEALLLAWLAALAPHRRVSAGMIRGKLYAAHVHHWVPLVFHLSRFVQLWRDAAGLAAGGRRRQIEEIGLSALLLSVVALWARDESPGQARTKAYLASALARADWAMARLFGWATPPGP